jgi:DNA-binding MarR family transcriptional regulator
LKTPKSRNRNDAPFAYAGLDRVIHEHARLSVLTSLITNPQGLTFTELKDLCALTDGNLSRHLQVLEEAGLVAAFKGTENNRSLTLCRVTTDGRKRYID